MIATHTIQDISFDQNSIQLSIDGKIFKISLDKISSKLKSANELQRNFENNQTKTIEINRNPHTKSKTNITKSIDI